ncbi:MAG TPA: flagellar hook-associated protein FlgL [Selenomonadales bacterium]|nr:flagellar hook-associated protein FlgL [Selenomonadales bacterium]
MRITDNMLTNNFIYNFNGSLSKISKLQDQLSSGLAVNKPSDDPVKSVRSLKFRADLTENDMFSQNASDAVSWMQTSDGAMTNAENVMQSIKTLIIRVTAPNPDIAYEAAAAQLDGYINELMNLGNTQLGGRYLFAGQNTQSQPFTRDPATGVVTYNGTYDGQGGNPYAGTVTMKVSPGAPDPIRDKVNVDGQSFFGTIDAAGQPQLFANLNQIKADMLAGDVDTLSADLGIWETDNDNLLKAQTGLGARQSVYTTMKERLTSDYVTIKSDLSQNEDLDAAKASIDFQSAQNVYNAALAIGAKILPQSLADYLK